MRGLLLLRVTGGPFAAGRLPENYYGHPGPAGRQGRRHARGLAPWRPGRAQIAANPRNGEYLAKLPAQQFIDVLTRWNEIFVAGGHYPVMGVSPQQLRAVKTPTPVIPGNDKTHASTSGLAAHRLIAGSELHQLPITDQDVPLIPFPDWGAYEPEIARVFADFMKRTVPAESKAA